MSVGNLKDQGNKGNNFPYQLKNLQLLSQIANAAKTDLCNEVVVTGASPAELTLNLNTYYDSNPNIIIVAKSVIYDSVDLKFTAFLTLSKI